ncbi:NAD(P)-binding domain-containing protein [Segnochrobactrum spirostomi]|uniref:Pyrroline-5-carboxylate reductase catalytic N-terminal domain-containing protein n=1 Tax=Segnochrobactrum spirostomi TaxID=2608987 RepID=A0A6A7Y9X1_9HYPH|nr:NAD(P)-binding domain-containing protein [Segnochrobactrum spirostomi]MQT14761.1 hypothetical protein [Segnochrobactrum spirostomi]
MPRLGFIGTGALTAAVVHGLEAAHGGATADPLEIRLTRRSEERSRALAGAYSNVTVLDRAADVVAESDIVFLAIRPTQLDDALAGLPFRPDQIVVSFLAGVPLAVVREKVAPVARVVRINPLPPIRFRKGPIMMVPAEPVVEALFRDLGDLIVSDREADLVAIANGSAVMSSHFRLQNTVIAWLERRGMASEPATLYVRSLFAGLAEVGLASIRDGEPLDPTHHETKGGLNERARTHLESVGWFDEAVRALDLAEAHKLTRAETPAPKP